MRKWPLFSAMLILFLLVPASITWAQTISSQKGLTTAVFPTQYGNVKIYLPDDIRAGDVISGTVVAEPKGNNARQLEKNLSELRKYSVSVDGNKYAVPEKEEIFKWIVQMERQLSCPIELLNVSGVKAQGLIIPIITVKADDNQAIKLICAIPTHALAGEPMQIKGSFDGDASNTKCTLGNQSLKILTESPRQLCTPVSIDIADPGGNRATVSVQENSKPVCSGSISLVNMQVTNGELNLRKGQSTYIDVKLTGLQDLPDTAVLSITNITPDVVTMTNGNVQVFPISPRPDSANGTFSVHCPAISIATGNFQVIVNLDLPPELQGFVARVPDGIADGPPIQFEQKELDEPRKLEDKALQIGLHTGIKKLIADAAGARGQTWNTVCDNCRGCIEARMGEWAADLVKDLGVGIIKEYLGAAVSLIGEAVKAVGAAKEFFDKISDKVDNAEKLADDIADKIRKGELKVMALEAKLCVKSSYCLIRGTIFYNPKTGCVFAIIYCEGSKLCCPNSQTIITMTYCTDEKGMPTQVPDIEVIKK